MNAKSREYSGRDGPWQQQTILPDTTAAGVIARAVYSSSRALRNSFLSSSVAAGGLTTCPATLRRKRRSDAIFAPRCSVYRGARSIHEKGRRELARERVAAQRPECGRGIYSKYDRSPGGLIVIQIYGRELQLAVCGSALLPPPPPPPLLPDTNCLHTELCLCPIAGYDSCSARIYIHLYCVPVLCNDGRVINGNYDGSRGTRGNTSE